MRTKLKILRVENHLNQEEMAKKIGISVGAYRLIELGKRFGSFSTWNAIQDKFNIADEDMWSLIVSNQKGE